MKTSMFGIVCLFAFVVAAGAASAQAELDSAIADELPGLELSESELFPASGDVPAAWQKIFRTGNNVVTIGAQDYGADSGLALANAFRAAAAGYDVAYEQRYRSEGVELGPASTYEHGDHPGVRVSERSFDNRTYFLAHYLEGSTGFVIVAVLEDSSIFDPALTAQLDHSTGARIDWEGNGGVLEGSDDADGRRGVATTIGVVGVIGALLAASGWWFSRRPEPDADAT